MDDCEIRKVGFLDTEICTFEANDCVGEGCCWEPRDVELISESFTEIGPFSADGFIFGIDLFLD